MHSAESKDCKAFVFNHVFSNLEMVLNILEGNIVYRQILCLFIKRDLNPPVQHSFCEGSRMNSHGYQRRTYFFFGFNPCSAL